MIEKKLLQQTHQAKHPVLPKGLMLVREIIPSNSTVIKEINSLAKDASIEKRTLINYVVRIGKNT
jgi:hypothetical protein